VEPWAIVTLLVFHALDFLSPKADKNPQCAGHFSRFSKSPRQEKYGFMASLINGTGSEIGNLS